MTSPDQNGGGGELVRYTTKELLAEIRDGIASIKSVASQHDLRITRVEEKVAEHTLILQEVNPQVSALQQIIDTQAEVKEALDAAAANVQHKSDSSFNRRDALLMLGFAAVTTVLNLLTLGPDLFH